VDPQGDFNQYTRQVENSSMVITAVIETHIHADHLSCARELATLTRAPLHLGPGSNVRFDHQVLAAGQTLPVGNRRIRVLHTPGHTPEHVSLLIDDWFVLTGDTLLVGDVGRVDLALHQVDSHELEQRAGQLYDSLRRLLELPDYIEVFPAHYAGSVCARQMDGKPVSTIGRERRMNPSLQMSRPAFMEFQLTNPPPLPEDFAEIKRTNLGLGRVGFDGR